VRGFFLQRQKQIFENVTLVARRRKLFWGFWRFVLLLTSLKKEDVSIHKNSLAFGVVTASSHDLWRVLSSKIIWVLGHCWVNSKHIYTCGWNSLLFQSCLLSTVTVIPSDLDYVNRSASIQRFRLIHTTPSQRSRVRFFAFVPRGACAPGSRRTKSLETVATRVVTSISVLFCERYWLAGVWYLCYVWWRELFFINCFGIELVLCDFKLFSTRFVLTEGLSLETFFFVFFTNCVVGINEYLNSNHFQFQCIGKPNKPLKWNAPQDVLMKNNAL